MLNKLLAISVALGFTGQAGAQSLPVAVPLEGRVEALEKEVKALRDKVSGLEVRCPVALPVKAGGVSQTPVQYRSQVVCDGGVCRVVQVPVPTASGVIVGGVSCQNCTVCGNNCSCPGGGQLCADGPGGICQSRGQPAPAGSFGGVGQSASCGGNASQTQRTGLFSGVRNRVAGRRGGSGGGCCGGTQ